MVIARADFGGGARAVSVGAPERVKSSFVRPLEYSAVAVKRWNIVSWAEGVAFLKTLWPILHVDTSRRILYYMHLQI